MTNSDHTDPIDGYDLREYRKAVAKFVKLMIRARAKVEPDFLTAEEYGRWHLTNIADDSYTLEQLLKQAETAHDRLLREFIGPEGSGGISPDDPRGELKENVVHFAMGTSPSEFLDRLRSRKKIKWADVAEWDRLNIIRDGLDDLPRPTAHAPGRGDGCPVDVRDPEIGDVDVLGIPKSLTPTRLNVIEALMEAFPATLTKDQLVSRSGHTDAVNIVKQLAASDPDWAATIKLAGVPGGGYGLRRTPEGT